MSPLVSTSPSDLGVGIRPVPEGAPSTILLRGISRTSPFGDVVAAALTGISELAFSDGEPPTGKRWRRALNGTALQWWSEVTAGTLPAGALDINLNLHWQEIGRAGLTWCVVDAAGVPLFHPFHGLEVCHSKPYVASLNLIESSDCGGTWQLVAEAHVSSIRSYRDLLDVLGRTTARLLQAALRSRAASRRPWSPGVPAPRRFKALLRTQIASRLAWFRARVSGEVYGIAVLDRSPAEFIHDQTCMVSHWLRIPASQGFIADPFFWPGRPEVLLCETYLHRTGLGELSVLTIHAGAITQSEPMSIGISSHLSYPSTWSEDGRVFCLPEMAASRRQVLYELCSGMAPKPLCVITEDVGMADPTLMKVDGLYWIAYTDTSIGTYDNLCLLHAERLEGPWRPHLKNPVKIDARSCRPGGTPFWVDGRLYRPAQDCSREYGGALIVNQIEVCTLDEYREVPAAMLLPDPTGPFPDGMHTLSFADGRAVIDGKRVSYHPSILFHKMFRRLKGRSVRSRLDTP